MFGISGFELVLILVFVLVVFGPDKLPELARTIGRAMSTFKRAQEDMERVIRAEMYTSDKKPAATAPSATAAAEGAATADQPKPVSQAEDIWAATDEADDEDEEDEE